MERDLVYDVGLHQGEDTEFYLKKGYRVVAFEAHPELVALCRDRFAAEIRSARLHIIQGAIAPSLAGDQVKFFVNLKRSVWGTITPRYADRNRWLGAESQVVEVERVEFSKVLKECGVPFYMKVDIEGAESEVLRALKEASARPAFISVEAAAGNFQKIGQDLLTLRELGYQRFKAVQQATVPGSILRCFDLSGREIEHVFSDHSSGPFGEDLLGPWRDYNAILAEYRIFNRRKKLFGIESPLNRVRGGQRVLRYLQQFYHGPVIGWYDTHAAL